MVLVWLWFGVVFLRKIRLTQLWVELGVAINIVLKQNVSRIHSYMGIDPSQKLLITF